ncbi:MAG: molybdopterin-dependent oxidoreductase [Chloroflexi bacterium]|nr:molybdopterin-dependent oxidoreductase [Chloroflexota bacterium]
MSNVTEIRSYCAQCAVKCGVIVHVEDGKLIAVRPDRDHPCNAFCIKGEAAPEIVYNAGRLKTPLHRTNPKTSSNPGWVPISWDEALSEAARRMLQLKEESGPESIAFSRPAPGGSAATDWVPWLVRLASAFGSPNVITTSHICQWGRDSGSAYTYGVGLPTPHFERSGVMLIWGCNPAVSDARMWNRIKENQRRGGKLVVVDPRKTETAARADQWIAVKPGTDSALLLGLIRIFIEQELYNPQFVQFWTNGPFLVNMHTGQFLKARDLESSGSEKQYVVWDGVQSRVATVDPELHPRHWGVEPTLRAHHEINLASGERVLAKTGLQLAWERVEPFTVEHVSEITSVAPEKIRTFAQYLATGGPLAYYTYNGIEQHINTAQTNRALCILYSLTGWFDVEGGNVRFTQPPGGDIDGRGILGTQAEKRIGREVRPLGAPRTGAQAYTVYDAILEGRPYRVRGLVTFGANIIVQNGDTRRGQEALRKLDFHLHADMFENPSARFADILLPASTCWESPALTTSFGGDPSTHSYMQYRAPAIAPLHESRPDMQIIFDLAVKLGLGKHFWDGDLEKAFRYKLAPTGITLEQLQAKTGGIWFPTANQFKKHAAEGEDGKVPGFSTPTRKMEIYSEEFLHYGYDPLPFYEAPLWLNPQNSRVTKEFPLVLTSAKLSQYVHSQGRGIPMLRRKAPEPFAEIHPDTARSLEILNGNVIRLSTPTASIRVRAKITDKILPGVIATQTGWWEACEELSLPGQDPFSEQGSNLCLVVTNDIIDPISGSVPTKAYPCMVTRIQDEDSPLGTPNTVLREDAPV